MAYQDPNKVDSPRGRWRTIEVLRTTGDGGDALAVGMWDGDPRLAMRWNGSGEESGVGSPQSRGLPTWFILPKWTQLGVLEKAELDPQVLNRAKAILLL